MDESVQTIGGRHRGGSGYLFRSGKLCARAAMVGEELVKSGDAVRPTVMTVAASRRWLRTLLRSDLGFVGGAEWLTANLVL